MIQVKADYLAERSIEDNILLESKQNSFIVIFSYTLMFLYVSIAIGFFPSKIYSKFALGAIGIGVVIGSLLMAMGLTFYANKKLTMISAEVERDVPECVTDVAERMSYAMKEIGPSVFTAALCETSAFMIGMLTDVPALRNFCLIAALGVACDFLL